MDRVQKHCFAAEKTLGKLAKWLRILGFDTLYSPDLSGDQLINADGKRALLTRTQRIRDMNLSRKCIFIASNDPSEQLRAVIKGTGITQKDIRPFSRCIRCNALIRRVQKDSVKKMVPDYVWESHDTFRICALCQRIYWPGSHTRHSLNIIESLFI
ncbi:MAG: Mut7-C RNAse domain-containing protein [Desulfobacterales bacterium]